MSKVTGTGGGAAPVATAPAAPRNQRTVVVPPAAPQRTAPQAPGVAPQAPAGGSNSTPPGKVAISAQACQQAIRANYPPGGTDQTITVNFLSFQMSGQQPYQAVYANDTAGHTVQAAPVHAKYTVLTHYADPKAPNELRTYDANYMCYRTGTTGELVVEMTGRVPGGETPTYIKKG